MLLNDSTRLRTPHHKAHVSIDIRRALVMFSSSVKPQFSSRLNGMIHELQKVVVNASLYS